MKKSSYSQEKFAGRLNFAKKRTEIMKVSIQTADPRQSNQVIQALSDAGLLDIADVEIYHVRDPQKRPLQPSMTIVHTHRIERGHDGRGYCRLCGQSFPLNRKGRLDEARLLQEMILPTRPFEK